MKRLTIAAALAALVIPALAAAQPTGTAPTQPAGIGTAPTQPAGIGTAPTQPGDIGTARTEPGGVPAQQVPARQAGFGSGRNNANPSGMPQIDQSDLNRMTDERRGNRAGEMPRVTPQDLERMRQEQRNSEIDPFVRRDPVRGNRPGELPTAEESQEILRRSQELRRQTEENFRQAADLDARTSAALRDSLDRSRQMFQGALDRGIAAANIALQAWQILHPSDHTCLANTQPQGMPIVPSMCAGSAECASCYSNAYGRLDRTRGNLEKLRCIYRWNKEYSDRATSFGDNVSSVHGISGLAWQQERRKIEKAVDQLGVSYDAKYRELLGFVRADLGEISACEARFFGNPDWATRYGFMFYGFLEDRYRR